MNTDFVFGDYRKNLKSDKLSTKKKESTERNITKILSPEKKNKPCNFLAV